MTAGITTAAQGEGGGGANNPHQLVQETVVLVVQHRWSGYWIRQ